MKKYFAFLLTSSFLTLTSTQAMTLDEFYEEYLGFHLSKLLRLSYGDALIQQALPLITDGMEMDAIASILKAVSNIPAEQREEVVALSKENNLITDTMSEDEVGSILKAVSEVPEDQCEEVVRCVKGLITEAMTGDEISSILEAVSEIPEAQRDGVVAFAKKELLTDGMNGRDFYFILKAVYKLPSEQRGGVVDFAKKELITDGMNGRDFYFILEAVSEIPEAQRDGVVAFAKKELITDGMEGDSIASILKAVYKLPSEQWDGVASLSKENLITDAMAGYEVCSILGTVYNIPEGQREEIVRQVRESVGTTQLLDVELIKKSTKILVSTPANQRENGVAMLRGRTPEEITQYFNVFNYYPQVARYFTQTLFQRYITAQAELAEGEGLDFNALIEQTRDEVTQRMAQEEPRAFHAGRAFEIHNAVKMKVTYGEETVPAYKAVELILNKDLGIKKMPLSACIEEMKDIPGLDNLDGVTRALGKAYYNPDQQELAYADVITPLLGYVWPYMKTRSEETRRAWLELAVAESESAYGQGDLSCAKGIQERLTVTGFLSSLEDVDERLIGISSLTDFTSWA